MDELHNALEKFHKSGEALLERAGHNDGVNEAEMHMAAAQIVHMAEHMDRLVPQAAETEADASPA